MSGRLISVDLIARWLNIPRRTMYDMIKKGYAKVVYDTSYSNYGDGTPGRAYMYESWYLNFKAWYTDRWHRHKDRRDRFFKRLRKEVRDGKVPTSTH